MRKFFYLLTSLALTIPQLVSAEKRSVEAMRQAVAEFTCLQGDGIRKAPALGAERMGIVREESQLTILAADDRFAVIANDDQFDAVLAYSETPFEQEALSNPGLRWWLEAMNEALEYHSAHGTRPHKVTVNPNYKASVESFVRAKWNQEEPYNWQTPTYTEKGKEYHFLTGCVATAMAEAMKHYNYPATGKGTASYRFNTTTPSGDPITQRVSVNFANGNYEWDKMLDSYSGSYDQGSGDAVAKLMAHCGASVKMVYNKDGSGSHLHEAAEALKSRFLYPENLHLYQRDYMHVDEWMDIVFRNLDQGCPILMGAYSKSGGHAFLLDGYTSSGLVSVNWGWGGNGDGYFDMASLNGYSSGQQILPVVHPEEDLPYHSCLAFFSEYAPSYRLNFGALTATGNYAMNTDYQKFEGVLGLLAQNMATGQVTELATNSISLEGYGYDNKYHFTQDCNFSKVNVSNLQEGTYRIYMASLSTKESVWQPVRCHESISNSAILTVAGDKMSIAEEKSSNWLVGIKAVKVDCPALQGTYNLQGQRVEAPQRGLYIRNGKKVVLR